MGKGLVLQSASYEPGGEETRQMNLEKTLEEAGYEVQEAPPDPEAEENDSLTQEQRFSKNIKSYGAQVEKAKSKYDDWNQVVNQDIFIGQGVQLAILEQPNAAEVSYYLGKHPGFAKKIGEMSKTPGREISAIREVERLSARLGGNTHTQAPRRPIRPPADASFAEIAAMPNFPGKARYLKRAQRR